eukprot:Selendium_serpulae@DN6282_c0_g1_i12.p1
MPEQRKRQRDRESESGIPVLSYLTALLFGVGLGAAATVFFSKETRCVAAAPHTEEEHEEEYEDAEESNETQWRPASASTSATTATPSVKSVLPTEHEASGQWSSEPPSGICGICVEKKVDRFLNCGHTMCGRCLLTLPHVKGYIDCPFCRKRVRGVKMYI